MQKRAGESWRVISNGRWLEELRKTADANIIKLYDGAGYAWESALGSKCLWHFKKKKNFVKNSDKVIDVDYPKDLEEFRTFIE